MKFAYKFLHTTNLPWRDWILHQSPLHIGLGQNSSFLAKTIFRHIHDLRKISQCSVGNCEATFFWLDRWLKPEPLALVFPALYTHHTSPNARVTNILQEGVELRIHNRLIVAASRGLASLNLLLQDVALTSLPDSKKLLNGDAFTTRRTYIPFLRLVWPWPAGYLGV